MQFQAEKLPLNANGTVSLTFLVHCSPHNAGETAGFLPEKAAALLNRTPKQCDLFFLKRYGEERKHQEAPKPMIVRQAEDATERQEAAKEAAEKRAAEKQATTERNKQQTGGHRK